MRRAIQGIAGALLALALLPAAALPQGVQLKTVNAIGLLDYGRPPTFKTGQWVKYRMIGQSANGTVDDYFVTIAIVGEERFWGEECFWIQTVTERAKGSPAVVATLMSYDIFKDPEAQKNLQSYQRKMIVGLDEEGRPDVQIMKRPRESLLQRDSKKIASHVYFDTLGTDTVQVPAGTFDVIKIRIRQGSSTSSDTPDSTQYTEMRETRVAYMAGKVPVSGLAREDVDYLLQRKTWLIGKSGTGDMLTLEHATGRANLIASGTGYKTDLLPPEWQHDLDAVTLPPAASAPAPRLSPVKRAARPRPPRR